MRKYLIICFALVMFCCSDDEKAIDVVFEGIERGAILRNINRNSKDFIHNDFESNFSITIEEQDLEEGDLLDFVRLFVAFEDNTPENGTNDMSELVLRDIPNTPVSYTHLTLPTKA